ncbi:alpha/beta hydrolase [Sphingomonas montana]|uniref:alpha/beta hydrolase n=1 Tax=Sphingomonas montana TaxID=1843236 RepID=UPI001F0B06C6|nr:alpha/beta hydrolase [Sphingomonas montana]
MTMQSSAEHRAIAAIGQRLGPDVLTAVQALFRAEQDALAAVRPATASDLRYGVDPRQTLDLYVPSGAEGATVLLWVHGGGFVRGEKASPDHPFNAHVGRWAARSGMVGAVMNYRLAPDHGWPAGGEDVGAAIAWLVAHVAEHGGDPARIVVMGTSAGAVHVATHLRLRPDGGGMAAAVLLSGLYGFTPLDTRDTLYYGDAADYPERRPREAVVGTTMPLFVACAEHDPARFQTETVQLLAARLALHGTLTRSYIAGGHNHFSLACHIGGSDTRLTDEVLGFIADTIR